MQEKKEIYDISITIEDNMLSFPGDTPPHLSRVKDIKEADYNLSKMEVSVHVGTHADAPTHFIEEGKYIDEINPERFMGKTQVIEIENEEKITREELKNIDIKADKILFKTLNSQYLQQTTFNEDFVYLTVEAGQYLIKQGVKLIGIDYLTIESLNSNNFEVHKLILGNDIIILEAVDLSEIKPGIYDLWAVPLKLKKAEASPIRALLIK